MTHDGDSNDRIDPLPPVEELLRVCLCSQQSIRAWVRSIIVSPLALAVLWGHFAGGGGASSALTYLLTYFTYLRAPGWAACDSGMEISARHAPHPWLATCEEALGSGV